MYVRRLVKSGLSSCVVAIPKEFIDQNRLHAGDVVTIDRQGIRTLIIQPGHQHEPARPIRSRIIEIAGRDMRAVERDLSAAYVQNCNEITIILDSPAQAKEIKAKVSFFVALEVVHEDQKRIVAKDFLNYRDADLHRTLKRIEHIVHSMLLEVHATVTDKELAAALLERDREVNRLGFLVMRLLQVAATEPDVAQTLGLDTLQIIRLWSLNSHLEKIGDEVKRMGKLLSQIGKPAGLRPFLALLQETIALYAQTSIAIAGEDMHKIDACLERRIALNRQIEESAPKVPHPSLLTHLTQILSHIADINRRYRYVRLA